MLSIAAGLLTAVVLLCVPAAAEDAAVAAQPTTRPAPETVVATVGAEKILVKDVDRMFLRQVNRFVMRSGGRGLPPEELAAEWKRTLSQTINAKLISAYLKNVDCPKDALEAKTQQMATEAKNRYNLPLDRYLAAVGMTEDELAEEAKLETVLADAASPAKARAMILAAPARFDGTSVQASHILIACDRNAAASVRDAARKTLDGLAEQIRSGKVTFEGAARAHSSCPSKDRGGDLGSFTFERMVVPFSEAAFSMKVGELSSIVETRFGMHLIKVTKRTKGSGTPGASASQTAENVLKYQCQQKILAEARRANPVVVVP